MTRFETFYHLTRKQFPKRGRWSCLKYAVDIYFKARRRR